MPCRPSPAPSPLQGAEASAMGRPTDLRRKFSGYFEDDTGKLFVPAAWMHKMHHASATGAVLKRAHLRQPLWAEWKRRYAPIWSWLSGWLYGGPLPAGVKIHHPSWTRHGHKPKPGDFT